MYNTKLTRDEFLNSHFLTIKLIDLQKSLLHRNKFVFEVVTDRVTEYIKKNYGELKRFVAQITNKVGMHEFDIQHHMRSGEQYKSIEGLFKKINSGYLIVKEDSNQTQISKKTLLRNYLYNLFYSNIEQASDDQDTQKVEKTETKENKKLDHTTSFTKTKQAKQTKVRRASQETKNTRIEETREEVRKDREKTDVGYLSRLKNLYRVKAGEGQQTKSSILKGINQIWTKEGDQWVLRTFSISEHILTLSSIYSQNKQIIALRKMQIMLVDVDYRRIELRHPLLEKAIEIRLRDITDLTKDIEELQSYVKLLTVLKQAMTNPNKIDEKVSNFVGIKLSNKKNKFSQQVQKKPAKEMVVKISHQGEVYAFPMSIDSSATIHLPIFNNYGYIDCEIVEEREAGLIPNFRYYSINFNLPVQNVYDQIFNTKPKRKSPEMKHFILESKMCNYAIKLDYIELGNFQSYCTYKPTDRFEGDKMPEQFTRSQFRIQKNRFKRIIYSIEIYLNYLKSLKNMENRVHSYIFYTLLVLIVLLYDANFMLHYFLATLAGVIMYCHPTSHSYFREIVSILKLQNFLSRLQKRARNRVVPRFRVEFKKDTEKKIFLQKFKFTSKKDRSIVQKYQRLHQVLLKGQIVLTQIVTISQKLKNIFMWYHHQKTKKILTYTLIGLTIIVFIPIRLILLAVIYKTFRRGLTYRARTKQMNRIILFEIFTLIIQENGFTQAKQWLIDPSKPLDRKSNQYINFERKVREWLDLNLQIQYDSELFWQSRTMNEVINYLSDCKKRFIIPEQICRRYRFNLEWSSSVSSLGRLLIQVYGFIVNIPSDRSILGIKHEQRERAAEQDQQQIDSEQFEVE